MRRLCFLALLIAAPVLLFVSAPAGADVFGPISLVSESPFQQAEYARDAAISGNGRYVAFDGSYGGVTGVWRRDLQTGVVDPVAVGGTAQLPSISESGRYVSFTTTAALSGGDHNEGPDVYVRDMSVDIAWPGAFTLASAVNGSAEGLSYQASSEPTRYGALASGRSALSADGRKVVFVTSAVSNLAHPETVDTPAMQVAVRDLDSGATQLVSVVQPVPEGAPPEPVSSRESEHTVGAVYTPGGSPPPFLATTAYGEPLPVGASISADGSTVAWLAQNIALQAPVLAAETLGSAYTEPLWRRIADGPRAVTRRVTGGSDPSNPACAASGEGAVSQSTPSVSDPCQGPFATFTNSSAHGTWGGGTGDPVPRLSADGYAVAFLANAPLVASGAGFGRAEGNSDIYVADMHGGLTREQALRQLTELASGQGTDLATNAPIVDLGISADASKVAFTTMRTVFPLGAPAYVSAPAAVPGMVELFDVDLADETLTRVTRGFEGGPSEHPHKAKPAGEDPYNHAADGALSPSFSSSGNTLAFASTAANLVYGDGNTPPLGHEDNTFDGSDAFVVSRVLFPSVSTEAYVSGAPPAPAITPAWRIGATALSRADGTVQLTVLVPGAGRLSAGARGAVRVRVAVAKHSRRASRRRRSRTTVATRTLATRAAGAGGAGIVVLTLKLSSHYASLAARSVALSATVNLLFSAPGHPTLRESLNVSFHRTIKARRAPARRASAHHRSKKGRR
jgi:hypothetical protein